VADYKLRIIIEGIDKASGALKGVGSALGDIGKIAAGVSIANVLGGATNALAGAARSALDAYASYERLGTSINSLAAKEALLTGQASSMQAALGQTAGKSKELLDWIQKLAIESPFKQEDVANAFRLSMALGFNTAEAQRLTQAMLNFSTATGAGGESMERISRALGQIRTKGKLSMEEVNQLTESGIDTMRILGDATGKTGKELPEAISKGAIDANFAIEAILKDTEKLYAGAGAAAAGSMSGLLSTLEEMGGLLSRDLFSGAFQAAQPYIEGVVGILTAPEFRAGVENWGATLGGFTADGLESAATAMERIDAAIGPLLDKGAPGWLVALQAAAAAGDYAFDVKISPEVTTLKTPDGGLTIDVTATATTITNKDGGLFKVDAEAQVISIDADTTDSLPPVQLVADWKEGTIGSLIAADWTEDDAEQKKILVKAGWSEGAIDGLMALLNFNDWAVKLKPVIDFADAPKTGFGTGFDLGKQIGENIDWEEYKRKWQVTFDSWKPVFSPQAEVDWGDELTQERSISVKADPFSWGDIWDKVYSVAAALTSFDWGDLWSKIYTVQVQPQIVSRYEDPKYGPGNSVYGPQMGVRNTAGSGLGGWDNPGFADDVRAYYGNNAAGTDYWRGGWTWVGEEGPELLNLPKGAQILSNANSKKLIGNLAEGTTEIPGWLKRSLSAVGLWVEKPAAQMGPKTREQSLGWQDFTRKGTAAMQQAAEQTSDAFQETAEEVNGAFQSALQGVPGLFGTSSVTGDQMKMAALGVPQNFADDYVRQLSDEVLNGVDWANVDVKDAAARAGIDPNLPANVILELFKSAWNDSSLFANAQNLDLINQDAVKAAIEQQQKEAQGKANIMALFGITDENMQEQADALGAGLASVFGKAGESDAMKSAGVAAFGAIGQGFGDANTAAAAVGGMAQAVVTATGVPENVAALEDAGKAGAYNYFNGWKSFMAEAAPPPPTGDAGTTLPAAPPPGNALGSANWRGGWTVTGEYGPELVNLPGGSRIYDAPTTRRMRAGGQRPTVVNQTFIVNDKLMAEQAARRAVQLIQRGS